MVDNSKEVQGMEAGRYGGFKLEVPVLTDESMAATVWVGNII